MMKKMEVENFVLKKKKKKYIANSEFKLFLELVVLTVSGYEN